MSDPAAKAPLNPAAAELDDVIGSIRRVGENLQGDREIDPRDASLDDDEDGPAE